MTAKEDEKTTSLVFVYGTLKTGYGNNRLLQGSNLLGEATTEEDFWLANCGFPYLLREHHVGDAKKVIGELWEVSPKTLESLDWLEGVKSGHYARRTIEVVCQGEKHNTNVYIFERGVGDLPLCPINEGGFYEWSR